MKEGTGCLSVEISLPQTKADAGAEYNALDYSTVRIFSIVRDTDNEIISENLVRKYRPASKMPASLYLAAGEYKITAGGRDRGGGYLYGQGLITERRSSSSKPTGTSL